MNAADRPRPPPFADRARGAPAMVLLSGIFALSAVARAFDPASAFAVEIPKLAAAQSEDGAAAPAPYPDNSELAALLATLREREAQLDARAESIARKARIVEAAEMRLRDQMERLEAAEAKLANLLQIADGAADKDIERLVAAFQEMDEKRAGPIFENMDVAFAAGLISRMEGGAAADILGALSPEKAYAVTVRIAGQNARAPTE